MKKLITIIFLAIISISLNAQITLDHSFQNQFINTFQTEQGLKYYYFDVTNKSFTIYNTDYSVYKQTTITLPTFDVIYIFNVSDKLFNTDASLEFLVRLNNNTPPYYYTTLLIDENNTIIQEFPNVFDVKFYSTNGNQKMLAIQHIYDIVKSVTLVNSDVYSLPGKLISSVKSLKSTTDELPYPNPSTTVVNLPYTLEKGQISVMSLYNLNGQLIEKKTIDSNFNLIMLDVQGYTPGNYIYEYNGKSSRFVIN